MHRFVVVLGRKVCAYLNYKPNKLLLFLYGESEWPLIKFLLGELESVMFIFFTTSINTSTSDCEKVINLSTKKLSESDYSNRIIKEKDGRKKMGGLSKFKILFQVVQSRFTTLANFETFTELIELYSIRSIKSITKTSIYFKPLSEPEEWIAFSYV